MNVKVKLMSIIVGYEFTEMNLVKYHLIRMPKKQKMGQDADA